MPSILPVNAPSLFTDLQQILEQHPWQLDLLLGGADVFPGVPLLYLLACSISEANLYTLRRDLNDISFNQLRRPDINLTDRLHNLRSNLNTLQTTMQETLTYTPTHVEEYFQSLKSSVPDDEYRARFRRTPSERLSDLLGTCSALHTLLLETFEILMGTIALLDSKQTQNQTRESLMQTKQAMLLSLLATAYLPLNLATSVFGMNLREMTGTGPRVWTFVVTALGLWTMTILAYGAVVGRRHWGHWGHCVDVRRFKRRFIQA
jgi:Mg2+ and Co2+ transporter CorA